MTAPPRALRPQPAPDREGARAIPALDAVVFDLDGTLWDSTATVARAWDAAVRRLHPRRPPVTQAAIAGVMGLAHADIARRIFPDLDPLERERVIAACYREEEARLRGQGGALYPGVAAGLEQLAGRVPLFIVSNCQAGYIETFLQWSGLGPRFRDHECHGRSGLGKRENLQALVGRQGLRRPLFVGDTASDEEAARGAGVPFVHAAYGFGMAERPLARCADFAAVVRFCLGSLPLEREPASGAPQAG